MKEIISNIRKNSFIDFIKAIIPTLLFCGMSIGFLYATFADEFSGTSLFLAIVSLPFGILTLIQTINSIKLMINPFNSNVFKKYGSAERIAQIYDEIERTTEFENDSIVISKNYLCDKKRAENLVAFNDVLAVHKLVHKVNFQVDYYQIVVTDKYGEEIRFQFGKKEEKLVNSLMQTIAKRTPNAELGYTQDELDHIHRNKIPLNNNSNTNNSTSEPFTATFKSDEQKRAERIKAAKRQNAFKNFWKCIGCIALSIVSSEMLLMIILGDSVEGASALVLLFVVAIPFFALFYYLFIGRKKKSSNKPYKPQFDDIRADEATAKTPSVPAETTPKLNTQPIPDKSFSVEDLAGAIAEMCLNELLEIIDICSKHSVSYDYKNLVISTFAYYYTIWLINFGNITVKQGDIVEEIYKEKFSLFNRNQFEDEAFKDVLQNETSFAEKLKIVDRRVRNSYHENSRTFVDDGISDEYILEFINDENDKDKIKPDIVIKVLKDWASKANIAGKQIKIID